MQALCAAGAAHAHTGQAEPDHSLLADRPTRPAPAQPGWLVAVDNWQTLEGGANTARIKQRTTGVYGGGEFDAGAGWRLGGALGATRSRVRIDAADARLDVYSYTAGIYGKRSFDAGPGKLNLLTAASYTWHDIDTRRHFEMPGIARQTLTADFSAYTAQAFSELGYELALSPRAAIEPFAGLAVRNVRTRSFSESGGSTALSGDAGRIRQTTTTLGCAARPASRSAPPSASCMRRWAGAGPSATCSRKPPWCWTAAAYCRWPARPSPGPPRWRARAWKSPCRARPSSAWPTAASMAAATASTLAR